MIRQYSLARDGERRLAPDFKVRELRCRDGSDTVMVDEALVLLLQCIREHFGKPVVITSGYRTAAHNAAVGGVKSSQHLLGRAADIRVQGVSVEDVAAYAESLMPSTLTPCTRISAARPSRCWLLLAPPTAALCAAVR